MNIHAKKTIAVFLGMTILLCTFFSFPRSFKLTADATAPADYMKLTGAIRYVEVSTGGTAVTAADDSVAVTINGPGAFDVYFEDYAGMTIDYDYCFIEVKNIWAPGWGGGWGFNLQTNLTDGGTLSGYQLLGAVYGKPNILRKPIKIDLPETGMPAAVSADGLCLRFNNDFNPRCNAPNFSFDFDVYFTDDPDFELDTLKMTGANIRPYPGTVNSDAGAGSTTVLDNEYVTVLDSRAGVYEVKVADAWPGTYLNWCDIKYDMNYQYCYLDVFDGEGTFNLQITAESGNEIAQFATFNAGTTRGLTKIIDTAGGRTDADGMIQNVINASVSPNGFMVHVWGEGSITFSLYLTNDPDFKKPAEDRQKLLIDYLLKKADIGDIAEWDAKLLNKHNDERLDILDLLALK